MANPVHVKILRQGVKVWNEWREIDPSVVPDLSGAKFEECDLSHVNFSHAMLRGASLNYSNLSNANLRHSNLSEAGLCQAYFCRADLSHADLILAQLTHANLDGAILADAILSGADFPCAHLTRANLIRADLSHTGLRGVNLSYANVSYANLTYAILDDADLEGTVFEGATFGNTLLNAASLSNAHGLHLAKHAGPSSIGIDTLYKSKGQIPEVFLRGCGVPDSFIDQAKALIGAEEGIQFYSCFISYSGKDEEFARRLHARLQQEHVRVWFAPHDMQSGKKLHEQIDEAIRIYDKLLILLSPHSILSDWVMTELRKARKAERKTGDRKLFPVGLVDYTTLQEWECFDADAGQDLAVEVRQYFIPDFTNWKDHDAFEGAFARLLKDLRANEKAAGSGKDR